jgi:ribosomal protein S17
MNQGIFFSKIKKLKQQKTILPYMCKVENNIVIAQMNQILTRQKKILLHNPEVRHGKFT